MFKKSKLFLINLIVFLLLLLVFEIFLGNKIYPNKLNCAYLLCSANHSYKNDLYEGKKYIIYKKDKYGFRGLRKNINEIDILVVGGSTTDERYLEIKDTWSEQLEKKINTRYPDLNLDVVNAGIDGQSTHGHIWNFENWFPRLKEFKPDFIIFYIGINDSLINPQQNKSTNGHVLNPSRFERLKDNIKSRSVFYDLLRKIKHKYYNRKEKLI